MKTIKLGRKEEMDNIAAEPAKNESSPRIYYPSLYLSERDGLKEAPDAGTEGTATIKYKIVSKNESERTDKDGNVKEDCSIELEVHEISFDSEEPMKKASASQSEDEIEKGLSESESEMEDKGESEEE